MRVRRLKKTPAHLEITAFINLIVVLVPFLLSVAVFTRLSVIELSLPAQVSESIKEKLDPDKPLKLEVVVRDDRLEVQDKIGGLIQSIPNLAGKGPDTKALSQVVAAVKNRFPQHDDATVLAENTTSYDTLVRVMDALRSGHQQQGGKAVRVDYFPRISIGDAPIASPVALATATGRRP
jgi:biopolymer transport protein ExbD